MDTNADKHTTHDADAPRTRCIPFAEFIANPAALFDEAASGKRITIERDGARFRLTPVRRRSGHSRRFSSDDALWDIAGIARSDGPGDVATNKHKYLADAYADLHEPGTPPASSETPVDVSPPDRS